MKIGDKEIRSVYIAGPMRGYTYFNFPAFDAARDMIQAHGYLAISPADLDRAAGQRPEDITPQDCAKRDIEAILNSDMVVTLDGIENSVGGQAEIHFARWVLKPIMTLKEFLDAVG